MKSTKPNRPFQSIRVVSMWNMLIMILLTGLGMNNLHAKESSNLEWPIPKEAFGVWDKRGEYLYDEKIPSHVKGMGIHMDWAQVQPDKNDETYFNWDHFEKAIQWAAKKKISVPTISRTSKNCANS